MKLNLCLQPGGLATSSSSAVLETTPVFRWAGYATVMMTAVMEVMNAHAVSTPFTPEQFSKGPLLLLVIVKD